MVDHREKRLLNLAVARGLVAQADVPPAPDAPVSRTLDPNEARWGTRLAQLLQGGHLQLEDLERLDRTLNAAPDASEHSATPRQADPAAVSSSLDEPAVPPADSVQPSFLQKTWSRYQFLRILGQGGMGIVYAARDPLLGRQVALKFLLGVAPAQTERFLQEARAQARVRHPGVCEVYEVGEVQGRAYIAMALIQGQPLQEAHKQIPIEQKLGILRDVAEAAQAAHRLGIVHRDLKPSNIIVQQNDDGSFHPVLMDFGLAHDPEAKQQLTRSGAVMGTPAYMSPEQARGDTSHIDRRTDVYSLGAVLYELLAGQPPFSGGSTLETLSKVVHDDPVPIHALVPSVPRDLETIAHKCLEKDPVRRYQSAQALGDDLQAYLQGNPIAARPRSWASRLWRSMRRHRWLVALCTLGFLSLASLAAVTARARVQSARELELGQRMAEQAREIEAVMRHGYLSPLHDLKRERQLVMEIMAQIEQQMRAAGPLAEGPGAYALGRGYLAMQDYQRAVVCLERAQRAGHRAPGLHEALGRTLAELFRIEWERLAQLDDPTVREVRRAELERQYRQPAIAHLAAYSQAGGSVAARDQEYVAALLAYCRGDYEGALLRAQQAFQRIPWLYEAKRLEGDVFMVLADERSLKFDYQGALTQVEKAREAYELAGQFGRSDPLIQLGQAKSSAEILGCWSLGLGRAPAGQIDAVRAAAARALQADPDATEAYRLQLQGYEYLVRYYQARGQTGPELTQAIELAEQFRSLHPEAAQALAEELGMFYFIKAVAQRLRGEDPSEALDKAESVVTEYLQKERLHPSPYSPGLDQVLVLEADVHIGQARFAMERGKTPAVLFDRIEALLDEGNRSRKPSIEFKQVRTQLLELKADYQAKIGGPFIPIYKEAIRSARDAQAAGVPVAFELLLAIYEALMNYVAMGSQESAEVIADADDVRVQMEKSRDPWLKRKSIRHQFYTAAAQLALSRHQDPSELLAKARAALADCLAQSSCPTAPQDEVRVHILRARWAISGAQADPGRVDAILQQGQTALAVAQRTQGTRAATYQAGARLRLLQAQWSLRLHRPIAALLTDGLELTQQALRIDAADAETAALEGALSLLRAQGMPDAVARHRAASEAVARLEEAVQRNPLLRGPYLGQLTGNTP